jgi:hypothetical protein
VPTHTYTTPQLDPFSLDVPAGATNVAAAITGSGGDAKSGNGGGGGGYIKIQFPDGARTLYITVGQHGNGDNQFPGSSVVAGDSGLVAVYGNANGGQNGVDDDGNANGAGGDFSYDDAVVTFLEEGYGGQGGYASDPADGPATDNRAGGGGGGSAGPAGDGGNGHDSSDFRDDGFGDGLGGTGQGSGGNGGILSGRAAQTGHAPGGGGGGDTSGGGVAGADGQVIVTWDTASVAKTSFGLGLDSSIRL